MFALYSRVVYTLWFKRTSEPIEGDNPQQVWNRNQALELDSEKGGCQEPKTGLPSLIYSESDWLQLFLDCFSFHQERRSYGLIGKFVSNYKLRTGIPAKAKRSI